MKPTREDIDIAGGWNAIIGFRDNPAAQVATLSEQLRLIGALLVQIRDAIKEPRDG